MKKRLLGILLSFAMMLTMMPVLGLTQTAHAADPVKWGADTSFDSDASFESGVDVTNNITITIAEGKTVRVKNGIYAWGKTLTVEGKGNLIVSGSNSQYGSGGSAFTGSIIVKGGKVTLTGGEGNPDGENESGGNGIEGNVEVRGGSFSATGGNGHKVGQAVRSSNTITCENDIVAQESANGSEWSDISDDRSNKQYVRTIQTYPLWVGGTQVTSANMSGTGWSYTPATTEGGITTPATLKLNGYSYEGTGYENAAIYAKEDLEIELTGDNTVTATSSSPTAYGVKVGENGKFLKISGNGKLTATGGNDGIRTFGDIIIDSGTVEASGSGHGIVTETGVVRINGGTVTASGSMDYDGTGIWGSDVEINSGTVTASGGGQGIYSHNNSVRITEGVTSVIASSKYYAITGHVKNAVAGTGWSNTAGTEGKDDIAVSAETGQDLSAFKKVQFPAFVPVASVTPRGGSTTEYDDFAKAVTAWNDASSQGSYSAKGATLKLLADVETSTSVKPTVSCSSDYPMILDLNGYGIRYTGEKKASVIMIDDGKRLKMEDSTPSSKHYITLDLNGRGTAVSDTTSEGAIEVTGGYITGGNGGHSFGGGINDQGSFTMTGGTIVGNTSNNGAGVCISITGSEFTMTGGTITGNKASDAGGGVRFGSTCVFNLSGGTITGNSAGTNGGGVYVTDVATFNLSGDASITGNLKGTEKNNVYLNNRMITVNGALTDGADIGVTMATPGVFTSSTASIKASDYKDSFFSDNSTYTVMTQGKELKLGTHEHNFTYSADGATITATCSAEGCPLPPSTQGGSDHVAKLTIAAPKHTTYGDGKEAAAQITDENKIQGTAVVKYYNTDAEGKKKQVIL